MSILNTKHCVYTTLGCCFLVYANHLGRHLDFLFFKQFMMQFLNWHGLINQKKTVRTIREVSFLVHIHVLCCCFLQYFPPFDGHFEFLNISKCSMMPRWHHSDFSSQRYQEMKSIKTFYAAHIARSQAKSMFGNWTIVRDAGKDFVLQFIELTFIYMQIIFVVLYMPYAWK